MGSQVGPSTFGRHSMFCQKDKAAVSSENTIEAKIQELKQAMSDYQAILPEKEKEYNALLPKRAKIDDAQKELARKLMIQRAGGEDVTKADEDKLALFTKVIKGLDKQIREGSPGTILRDFESQIQMLENEVIFARLNAKQGTQDRQADQDVPSMLQSIRVKN